MVLMRTIDAGTRRTVGVETGVAADLQVRPQTYFA
jgi:hypothetical protein